MCACVLCLHPSPLFYRHHHGNIANPSAAITAVVTTIYSVAMGNNTNKWTHVVKNLEISLRPTGGCAFDDHSQVLKDVEAYL